MLLALIERPLLDLAKSKGVGRSIFQPASALSLIFLAVGGCWLLWRVFRNRKTGFSHLDLACGVLAGAGFLSILSSPDKAGTFEAAVRFAAALGMYVILRRLLWDRKVGASWLLVALGASVFLVVAYIVVGAVLGVNIVDANRGTFRLAGPFLQANTLAKFLLPHVVIGIASLKHLQGRWRIAVGLLTAGAGISLLLTLTITSWIGLAVAAMIIALIQSRWLLVAMPVAGILFLLMVPSALDRLTDIEPDPDQPRAESSLEWRIEYWGQISTLNSSNPVTGVGLRAVNLLTPEGKEPHNDYLRAYVEMGIIGLAGYLALITGLLRIGWEGIKRTTTGIRRGLAVGMFAYAAAFAFTGFGENAFIAVVTMWYVLAYAALTEHITYVEDDDPLAPLSLPLVGGAGKYLERMPEFGDVTESKVKVRTLVAVVGLAFLAFIGFDRTPTQSTVSLSTLFEGPQVAAGPEWPTFGTQIDEVLVAPDELLAASTVDRLSIRWRVPIGGSSLTTPAVATVDEVPLVVVGDQRGFVTAFDANSGARVWSVDLGGNITSSPVIHDGVVYAGSSRGQLHALDASTGSSLCATETTGNIQSAPLVVDPDGTGPVGTLAYFGDASSGGDLYAVQAPTGNPATDCSIVWVFGGFASPAGRAPGGVVSSPTMGWGPRGRPTIITGSSGPGGQVHGIDGLTGEERWRFRIPALAGVGGMSASAVVSPPAHNEFANGVAYVTSENRTVYALDLVDGSLAWEFAMGADSPEATSAMRSTPTLVRNRLYVAYGHGVYSLNAQSGLPVWRSESFAPRTDDIVGSLSVSGPRLDRVVLAPDVSGEVHAFGASNGQRLWSSDFGAPVRGGVSVVDGRVFVADADGFLSRFDQNASTVSAAATIISPADGSNPENPNGQLTVTGTATSFNGVGSVAVAIRDESNGSWWNARAREWSVGYSESAALLEEQNAQETNWNLGLSLPISGGEFRVIARTVTLRGILQPEPTESQFFVPSRFGRPDTVIQTPVVGEFFVVEGSEETPLTISGLATDRRGNRTGVARVMVTITNLQDQTFFCNDSFCGAPENGTGIWTKTFARVPAELADSGAQSTTWEVTVPIEGDPSTYRIDALAVDRDGERDQSPARVERVCFLAPSDRICR